MKRALALVEGQTEERFVKEVLAPYLWPLGVHLDPKILMTKRVKRGPDFKGGIHSFGQLQRDLPRLLGDTDAVLVTTMLDLYGLPDDVPGMRTVGNRRGRQKAEFLEEAIEDYFQNERFAAFLLVHEFEAIAYVDPVVTARVLQAPESAAELQAERNAFATAEDVNDGKETHPSYRIKIRFPYYQKPVFGPAIVGAIGLPKIREDCPHFSQWLARLEALGRERATG